MTNYRPQSLCGKRRGSGAWAVWMLFVWRWRLHYWDWDAFQAAWRLGEKYGQI